MVYGGKDRQWTRRACPEIDYPAQAYMCRAGPSVLFSVCGAGIRRHARGKKKERGAGAEAACLSPGHGKDGKAVMSSCLGCPVAALGVLVNVPERRQTPRIPFLYMSREARLICGP